MTIKNPQKKSSPRPSLRELYERYEQEKKRLQTMPLDPHEYQREVIKIARRLGL